MERQKFEDTIKDAFGNVEVSPSENVWTNIELNLERKKIGVMRKRLYFFKLVAAASFAFAMVAGAIGYYALQNSNSAHPYVAQNATESQELKSLKEGTERQPLASPNPSEQQEDPIFSLNESHKANAKTFDETTAQQLIDSPPNMPQPSTINVLEKQGTTALSTKKGSVQNPSLAGSNVDGTTNYGDLPTTAGNNGGRHLNQPNQRGMVVAGVEGSNGSNPEEERVLRRRQVPLPSLEPEISIVFTSPYLTPTEVLLAEIAALEESPASRKRKSADEKIWTTLAFSAGAMDLGSTRAVVSSAPISTRALVMSRASTEASTTTQTEDQAMVYAMGIQVGGKISERWVVQGGLNYLNQQSTMTSYISKSNPSSEYALLSAEGTRKDQFSIAEPGETYQVNDQAFYLSIPVQAGYLALNRKVAIQLNGGFSTDLLVGNKQESSASYFEALDQASMNSENNQPSYKPMNISGLLGSEISVLMAEKYRMALSPGLRYPISSIYEEENEIGTGQLSFNIGVHFRYIFK